MCVCEEGFQLARTMTPQPRNERASKPVRVVGGRGVRQGCVCVCVYEEEEASAPAIPASKRASAAGPPSLYLRVDAASA